MDRSVVMVMSDDGCIAIFAPADWEPIARRIVALPGNTADQRDLKRVLSDAWDADLDSSGRLALPVSLREDAGITAPGASPRGAHVVLAGVGDHLECWSLERWQQVQERRAAAARGEAPRLSRGF